MKSIKSLNKFKKINFNQYLIQKSFLSMLCLVFSIALLSLLSKIKFIKQKLLKLIPSGSGPTAHIRGKNWFTTIIVAESKNKKIRTTISGGDPGYGETSKFISETALSIILDSDRLVRHKGILTPIECMGDLLINRLKESGISITTELNQ